VITERRETGLAGDSIDAITEKCRTSEGVRATTGSADDREPREGQGVSDRKNVGCFVCYGASPVA
jgi:hypothetical protein